MKIVSRSLLADADWDEVAEISSQGWLFHLGSWIEHEARITGARDVSFAVVSKGVPICIVPLFVSELGLGSFVERLVHNALHRHTGAALIGGLSQEDAEAASTSVMREIQRIAEEENADRIHLGLQNLSDESLGSTRREVPDFVHEHGFHLGIAFGPMGVLPAPGFTTTVVDQIVDLRRDEDQMFADLKQVCRRNVRSAAKAGVAVVDVTSDVELVDRYYALAERSARRTGESIQPRDAFDALFGNFAPLHLTALMATKDDVDVAAAILLHFKGKLYYFAGASDPDYLKFFVNDALQWGVLKHGRAMGYTHYRLGPIFPTVPRGWPIETVSRFKSKFGAKPWTIIQGSHFRNPEKYVPVMQAHLARLQEENDVE
ncbi:MAG: hypothetical protein NPIRA05_02930 [Nitrospirales bacterium]|nr:MAG: hypothetical protein NPIRA05_02930 [Nitrospirales bacterium]